MGKSRFYTAAGAAGAVCLFLLFLGDAHLWGVELHRILFFGGLYLAVIPAARTSVGLFCEERRNQTLELLYLTGMGPGQLFTGKLLGGVLIASGDLLALVPFLAVPFLSGGLSLDLFWATFACFPVLLGFTVAVGVLASVVSRDDGAALTIAVLLGGGICVAAPLPYMMGMAVAGHPPFSSHWLCLSPAYAPYLVERNFAGGGLEMFWLTAGATAGWALLGLGLAAGLLRVNWRQETLDATGTGWRGRWQSWVHGSPAWRDSLRKRLLSGSPFQWLTEQDRRPVLMAWGLIGTTALFWLLGWAAWPRVWPSPMNLYLTAIVLVLGTGRIAAYAASRRMALDRRDGSLELLLTTSLQPEEITQGQSAALRAQFRPVRWTVFGLCLLMMLAGFLTRPWNGYAAYTYMVIWSFLLGATFYQGRDTAERAMWIALNTGRSNFAFSNFHRGGWWWYWMIFNARNFWGGLTQAGLFPSGSRVELFSVTAIAIVILVVVVTNACVTPQSKKLLIMHMRSVARQPLPDRSDPRLRKWDGRSPL